MALSQLQPAAGWFGTNFATNTSGVLIDTGGYYASVPQQSALPPSRPKKVDPVDWLRERVGEVVALGEAA